MPEPRLLALDQLDMERRHDVRGYLVLQRKDIGKLAVEPLGPELLAARASTSCAVMRTLAPTLRTLPSST